MLLEALAFTATMDCTAGNKNYWPAGQDLLLASRSSIRNCRLCLFQGVFEKLRKRDFYLRQACLWVRPSVRPSVRLSILLSVCPSVRMEQLGSYWTDFYEIPYLRIFRKSVENKFKFR
jgi:hypothetical protein